MLELIVSDEVDPALRCPHCKHLYVRCSLPIRSAATRCVYCGAPLLPTELAQSIPAGLSIVDYGDSWSITVTARSRRAVLAAVFSSIVALAGLMIDLSHFGWVFGGRWDDPFGDWPRLLTWFLVALPLVSACSAAWWYWGRYSVSGLGQVGIIFHGLGNFGIRQMFDLPPINGVCLKVVVDEESRHQTEKHVIQLEGVDLVRQFGAELSSAQRAYIALFLMQKVIRLKTTLSISASTA